MLKSGDPAERKYKAARRSAEATLQAFQGVRNAHEAESWKRQARESLEVIDRALSSLQSAVLDLDDQVARAKRKYREMNPIRRLMNDEPSALGQVPERMELGYAIQGLRDLGSRIEGLMKRVPESEADARSTIRDIDIDIDELRIKAEELKAMRHRLTSKLERMSRELRMSREMGRRPLTENEKRRLKKTYRRIEREVDDLDEALHKLHKRIRMGEKAKLKVRKMTR